MSTELMSYISTSTDYDLKYFTIRKRLEDLAEELLEKEIYVFVNPDGTRESITANALYRKTKSIAQLLCKLGVRKGDVVVSCIPNNLNSLICTFGIICSGGIVLNTALSRRKAEDVEDTLIRTNAKGLILEPGIDDADLKACMNFIENVTGNGSVSSKSVPSLQFLLSTTPADGFDILTTYNNDVDTSDVALPNTDPEDYAVIFTTSGSTGNIKFVPQSHHTAMIVGHELQESMLFERDDVIYTERRMAWIGGFPYMYLHNGVKTVTKTAPFSSFRKHCMFTANVLDEEKCTIACLFPATIIGITDTWKETRYPQCMLKNIHTGALPVADVCMDAIGRYTTAVTNVYGSSEGGFFAANLISDSSNFTSHCAGKPLRGVELKVVDKHGMVVPRGVHGVIHARSSSLFCQYFNDEVRTREVLSVAHWMDTDDIGFISRDGKLTVAGRKSDIILQGGRNFVPSVVEAFIKTHPDVIDVLVVSIPDDTNYLLVCACVIGKPDRNLTAEEIKSFMKADLTASAEEAFSQAIPEHVLIYSDYPRLHTGKPDKIRLRSDAISRLKREKNQTD